MGAQRREFGNVQVADTDGVAVSVAVGDGVTVSVAVGDGVAVSVVVGDGVAVSVVVGDGVPLRDCDGDPEREGVCVNEAVAESDWDWEAVSVIVGDCVDVTLGLRLDDGDDVCVGKEQKSAMRRLV